MEAKNVVASKVPFGVVGLKSLFSWNDRQPDKIVDLRYAPPSREPLPFGDTESLDFGRNDGLTARGTGIRLSPAFYKK